MISGVAISGGRSVPRIAYLAVVILCLPHAGCGTHETPETGSSTSISVPVDSSHIRAEKPAPIQVTVTKRASSLGRLEYGYTVINRSAFPITALLVGYDEYYGRPLLHGEPYGWDGDTVPSSSFRAPSGWEFSTRPTEEDSLIYIKWEIAGPGRAIEAGDSLGGFAVVLDKDDPGYGAGGLWTAYVRGETPFWGALTSR